jgi:hypothetical protein
VMFSFFSSPLGDRGSNPEESPNSTGQGAG